MIKRYFPAISFLFPFLATMTRKDASPELTWDRATSILSESKLTLIKLCCGLTIFMSNNNINGALQGDFILAPAFFIGSYHGNAFRLFTPKLTPKNYISERHLS